MRAFIFPLSFDQAFLELSIQLYPHMYAHLHMHGRTGGSYSDKDYELMKPFTEDTRGPYRRGVFIFEDGIFRLLRKLGDDHFNQSAQSHGLVISGTEFHVVGGYGV